MGSAVVPMDIYARQVEVVGGGVSGRVGDERRGLDGTLADRGRRSDAERAGAVGIPERRQAVGEFAGAKLGDEGQVPPAHPHQTGRPFPAAAAVDYAAERDAGNGGLLLEREILHTHVDESPPFCVRLVVRALRAPLAGGADVKPQRAVARQLRERRRRVGALYHYEVAARVDFRRERQRRRADGEIHDVRRAIPHVLVGR